jgi:hypothetical protein
MVDRPSRLSVATVVETIVRDAALPSARERDALRRELMDHFEDASEADDTTDADVLGRFGSADDISAGFRRAYRRGRHVLYVAKVVASIVVAASFSLAFQLPLHLQLASGTITIAPLYVLAALLSVIVVLIVVAAWELEIEWLCTRLERDPVRLVGVCVALFVVLTATHAYRGMQVTAGRALLGAVVLVAVWTSSLAILSRADRAFASLLGDAV